MGVYRPPSVAEEPDLTLTGWRVTQLADGTRHICGVTPWGDGRVTSKILTCIGGVFTTNSGRQYRLDGPPAPLGTSNADYVWGVWTIRQGLLPTDGVDVSDEYFGEPRVHRKATSRWERFWGFFR